MSTPASTAASKAVYQIDPAHTHAEFKVRHMMIANITGSFSKVSGTVTFDSSNPSASKIDADLQIASLYTGEEQRDAHLKGPEFFDAEKYPAITFRSRQVVAAGPDRFEVAGDLALHGVTKQVK